MRSALGAALFLTALFAAPFLPLRAQATPITGGQTSIEITGGAGELALGTLGTASFDLLGNVLLPVTGGDVDLAALTGTIEHDGSGISVSSMTQGVVSSVNAENFVIDLTNGVLTADLSFYSGGMLSGQSNDVTLFDVRSCQQSAASDPCLSGGATVLSGFGLRFADGAPDTIANFLFANASAGDAEFIANELTGLDFGIANTRIELVPEPGAAAMLFFGLGGLFVAGRKRSPTRRAERR